MKKLLSFLFSKATLISAVLLTQVVLLFVLLYLLSSFSTYFYAIFQALNIIVLAIVVLKHDHAAFKLSWLIFIMIFPLVGGVIYIFYISSASQSKIISKKHPQTLATLPKLVTDSDRLGELYGISPESGRVAQAVEAMSSYPVLASTSSSYFESGEAWFPVLLEKLGAAERFIFLEYFIVMPGKMFDPVLALLKEKVQRGVEVRFMFDDLGCISVLPNATIKEMIDAGIKVTCFNPIKPKLNPVYNYRNHRKICVIDGEIAFCGGLNLSDEYINAYPKLGYWKDTAVMLEGMAVNSFTEMFLLMWDSVNGGVCDHSGYLVAAPAESDGFVQPYTDLPTDANNVTETAYRNIFGRAKDYIYITTPYLIIHDSMVDTLILAAKSGVDVKIITPAIGDKWYVHAVSRSYYRTLLEGGVKIYEYTPGFIHAKMIVCDDDTALVGTTNMDYRSFYLHCECACIFYRSSVIGTIKNDVLKALGQSKEITLDYIKSTPLIVQVFNSFLKLFSPLM